MGKKRDRALGCVLINDHRKSHKRRDPKKDSWLHTTEMDELPYAGYDAKLDKLKSCTEQSNLMEFLSTAELAGQDFTSERNAAMQVIDLKKVGLLSRDVIEKRLRAQEAKKDFIRIPRRPPWDCTTTPEELELNERLMFIEWRRRLATLNDDENVICTPFEKNLELWRQLWRVVERSDVLVQIVDARNPLLFYCPDLEAYTREVDPNKECAILMNKSDLLTEKQRQIWAAYFKQRGMKVVFWSALAEAEKLEKGEEEEEKAAVKDEEDDSEEESDSGDESVNNRQTEDDDADAEDEFDEDDDDDDDDDDEWETESEEEVDRALPLQSDLFSPNSSKRTTTTKRRSTTSTSSSVDFVGDEGIGGRLSALEINTDDPSLGNSRNSPSKKPKRSLWDWDSKGELVDADRLLRFFSSACKDGKTAMKDVKTIGLVGYPNVGKSSTINAILDSKKVAVSATPGKTKHFQTIYVDPSLMLCDCPGLVFPSFVTSKEELILNGILSVDQLRDYTPPINLLCDRMPRGQLESVYGIRIPLPPEGEEGRAPNAEEFLSSYGLMRGYMTSQGRPDCARSARVVLKDHVNGKLLFACSPPGVDETEFYEEEEDQSDVVPAPVNKDSDSDSDIEAEPESTVNNNNNNSGVKTKPKSVGARTTETDQLDREFFNSDRSGFGTRGQKQVIDGAGGARGAAEGGGAAGGGAEGGAAEGKPWKKHNNRNKKEKLRRIHGYLDQH